MSYEFIEKTLPENVGISSEWIESFVKRLREIDYDIHSLQIVRDGKLCFASAASPHELTDPHRLLSAAKPIIALAVLFAIDEEKLSFEDKVVSFFEDMLPDVVDERMKRITLYDLLTMQTGQNRDDAFMKFLGDQDINLCREFFHTPMDAEPGTCFFYNNSVPHLLFFMVERATKEDIVSYIHRKICEPLDMTIEAQRNKEGIYDPVTTVVTPEGFLKLALFFQNHGVWNGKQVIKRELIDTAVRQHTWTGNTDEGYKNNKGYCMQIWRNAFGGSRMDGGGGQLAFLLPENDMVVTIMGNEGRVDTAIKYFYEEIYSKVSAKPMAITEKSKECLSGAENLLTRAPINTHKHEKIEDKIGSCAFSFSENSFGLEEITLSFEKEITKISVVQNGESYAYKAGLVSSWEENDRYFIVSPDTSLQNMIYGFDPEKCYMSAGWENESSYLIVLKSRASMGEYRFRIKWNNNGEIIFEIPNGVSAGMKAASDTEVLSGMAKN